MVKSCTRDENKMVNGRVEVGGGCEMKGKYLIWLQIFLAGLINWKERKIKSFITVKCVCDTTETNLFL